MTERPISADERWTIVRRRDWPHDHGSLVAHGAPVPQPDEQLEVFAVVRAAEVEQLRAECRRYRDALIRCATVSGADVSGGVPTWPSVDEWAVQEVQELRDNYDADEHD